MTSNSVVPQPKTASDVRVDTHPSPELGAARWIVAEMPNHTQSHTVARAYIEAVEALEKIAQHNGGITYRGQVDLIKGIARAALNKAGA